MAKLFISHATEDKPFARPLAEELRSRGHEVWFDEFSMTMGDSLRAKIDEGLARTDFGVVVLSPRFFEKVWAQMELDALVSMESRARKIILPVWLDLDKEAVAAKSPLLASRIAAHASSGISAVADAIEAAIYAQERSIGSDALSAAVAGLIRTGATHRAERVSDEMLRSGGGPGIVDEAFRAVVAQIERSLVRIRQETGLEFNFHTQGNLDWGVRTVKMLGARMLMLDMYANAAHHCRLVVRIYQFSARGMMLGESPEAISEVVFRPFIISSSEVVWRTEEGDEIYAQDDLAAFVIQRIADAIDNVEAETEG